VAGVPNQLLCDGRWFVARARNHLLEGTGRELLDNADVRSMYLSGAPSA